MEKIKGMATCKVCGRDFPLIFEEHKVVRDSGKKANLMGAFTLQDEEALWDAFDCPHCGCQNVMQERKHLQMNEECEKEEEEEEEKENISAHDGCSGCVYDKVPAHKEPCCKCSGCYLDLYEKEEK